MGAADEPVEQARRVAVYASELGLQPSPPPEPLPEITEDDVHLICWLAIVPADPPQEEGETDVVG